MTVPAETSQIDYTGNDATTEFPVTFPWQEDEQLIVTLLLDGEEDATTQVLGVDYELDGAGDDSGTLTMTDPPPADSTLHIERTVDIIQEVDLSTFGNFSPETHEAAWDYLTYICQELDRRISALEQLGAGLVETSDLNITIVTTQFTADTPVEDTFPFTAALPADFTASGVKVTRARNLTDDERYFSEAPWVDWEQNGSDLTFRNITGLEPGYEYRLTLEVTGVQA